MIIAPKPVNETERMAALYEYNLLDTMAEKDYDDITKIAAGICDAPISLISLIDNNRQWFKSRFGCEGQNTDRDLAFCAHAILSPDEVLLVKDATTDERFHDNPLVSESHVTFYAGVPLVNETGNALGTLCVIDMKPKDLSPEQLETLKALARQIVSYFEIRKKNQELAAQKAAVEQANRDLSNFSHALAHDMRSPLNSITVATEYLKDTYGHLMDQDGIELLELMNSTAHNASRMVEGMLRHTLIANTEITKERFTFGDLVHDVRSMFTIPGEFRVEVVNPQQEIYSSRYMLMQILMNLCNNAVKYNDKQKGILILSVKDKGDNYTFSVKDNGPGISAENASRVFDLFTTLGMPDRNNNMGTGIGLATVKRLVEKMVGSIELNSEVGRGSSFNFTIHK